MRPNTFEFSTIRTFRSDVSQQPNWNR